MKNDGLELEQVGGTRALTGTSYILEGNLAYIEQEEKGKVTVVTASGLREIASINELDNFLESHNLPGEIREDLEILISKILEK